MMSLTQTRFYQTETRATHEQLGKLTTLIKIFDTSEQVDLGIQWSWKKREQPNEPVTNQPNETVATPVRNRESNTLQGSHSESRVLTSKPSRNSKDVTDVRASAEPNKPVSVTVAASKQNTRKRTRNQTKQKSPNKNDVKVGRPKRAAPRTSRKAKNEPIVWPAQKTTVPEEQTRLEKPCSQNENLDSILNSLAGLNSRAMKPEPAESCLFDEIVDLSSFVSSQNQKPSYPSLRISDNHCPSKFRTWNIAPKRKIPEICDESAPTNPYPRNPTTRRKKSAGMIADLTTRLMNQPLGVSDEAVSARLRKVIDVTQR